MSQNTISTRFSDAYGVKHPFACAGMAFVGMTPDLCIAVCKAGGIGALGVGLMPPDVLRMMIQGIKQAVQGPFNINFITIFTDPAYIDVCVEEQVPIVSFHWGNPPAEMMGKLQAAGIKVWEQVGSVEAAKKAVASGVDVVIAQGSEAGGHNYGAMPLFTLLPEVIDAVGDAGGDAMVLASGGIADGRAVAGALGLGADGVWVGTRLVASVEAFAHDDYKARLVAATGTNTTLSGIFGKGMPGFNPMRVLRNKVFAEYEGREDDAPADTTNEPVVGHTNLGGEEMDLQRFTNFVPMPPTTGDFDEMPLLCGQGVGQVKAVEPAVQIVERMMADAAGIVGGLKVAG